MEQSTRIWHVINLGDALLAYGAQEQTVRAFQRAFEASDRPDNMALFVRHESDGRLQCEVKLYFSPEGESVARSLGAFPCNVPSFHDLSLVAGAYRQH